jgi:cyclic beta-1,2-glucan synthetase
VVFLPYEATSALGAIFTTLYRLVLSRHHLLQWTTAAQTVHLFGLKARRNVAFLKMIPSGLLALILAVVIQLGYMVTGRGLAPALIFATPVLLLWILSPLVALWISRPIKLRQIPLSDEQSVLLRQVTRRTWGFFERFVGPEDHWLPPDHFQESPVGIIAITRRHQTSDCC